MSVANVSFKDTEGVSYANVSSCISHKSKIALKRRKDIFLFFKKEKGKPLLCLQHSCKV